mgnify:CR=1 FL=1
MKIVFMGTPEFAVPSLEKLIECGYEIPMVVTQPDRRGNRGKITFSPVKECALQHGLPVAQPQQIRKDEEFMQELEALEPDFIVVAAFGQLLPERVLNTPKYDCINVHGSLLPKLRGAAPMLKLAQIATHVAATRTMVLHPASHTHRQMNDEQLAEAGVSPGLIRLSIGIESAKDIIADLEQALQNA